MPVADPAGLFLEELGDVLYAERQIEKALGKLAREAQDDELSQGFDHHRQETRDQIGNLEQVFRLLGKRARGKRCPGIDGILEEGEEFLKENGDSDDRLVDLFLTGAALRVEHYEIAAYTALLAQADRMGEPRIAQLLRENLAQEEKMAKAARKAGVRLAGAVAAADGRSGARTGTGSSRRRDGNGGADGLTRMLKEQLVEMARKAGLEGVSRMRKDELIRQLRKRS